MAEQQDKPIRIRVDIEIPTQGVPASGVQASVVPASSAADIVPDRARPRPRVAPPVVDYPQQNEMNYPCRNALICVLGSALGAHYVFAVVYATSAQAAAAAAGPPPEGCPWTRPDPVEGTWEFSDVNGENLPVFLGSTNYLVVWTDDYSGIIGNMTVPFTPVEMGMTFCQGSGGSSGSGSGSGSCSGSGSWSGSSSTSGIIGSAGPAHELLSAGTTVPRLLMVAAVGFTRAQFTVFNAQYLLTLREPMDSDPVWDNAADGKSAPLVQLEQKGELWLLTFRHGSREVSYGKPAQDWQPLTANVLTHAGKGSAKGVPKSLTIVPV